MKIAFIQLSAFASAWRQLKLGDDDLRLLEQQIAVNPDGPPVMRGTGGLRKIRFAAQRASRGRSGGIRVCYAYFAQFGLVYFCAAFSKNAQANLSKADCAAFHRVLTAFEQYLRANWSKGITP